MTAANMDLIITGFSRFVGFVALGAVLYFGTLFVVRRLPLRTRYVVLLVVFAVAAWLSRLLEKARNPSWECYPNQIAEVAGYEYGRATLVSWMLAALSSLVLLTWRKHGSASAGPDQAGGDPNE